jgi:hypothetical protein
MLMLILFLVVGSFLAYVSQYNLTPVTVNLGLYLLPNIPLFYLIIGSLVAGLILAYLSHLIYVISQSFALRGTVNELKRNKQEGLELAKRIHQLEIENEKLRQHSSTQIIDTRAL